MRHHMYVLIDHDVHACTYYIMHVQIREHGTKKKDFVVHVPQSQNWNLIHLDSHVHGKKSENLSSDQEYACMHELYIVP